MLLPICINSILKSKLFLTIYPEFMKLDFDVSTNEHTILSSILNEFLPSSTKVWVFGSRAQRKTRRDSDLDLALEGPQKLPRKKISFLKDALSEAPLPYRVDVLDMNDVSEEFYLIVKSQAIEFPLIPNNN